MKRNNHPSDKIGFTLRCEDPSVNPIWLSKRSVDQLNIEIERRIKSNEKILVSGPLYVKVTIIQG